LQSWDLNAHFPGIAFEETCDMNGIKVQRLWGKVMNTPPRCEFVHVSAWAVVLDAGIAINYQGSTDNGPSRARRFLLGVKYYLL
jgi:hypothetical protein